MLWRILQSPLRLTDKLLGRSLYHSTPLRRSQIHSGVRRIRPVDDQKVAKSTIAAPPLVRHDRLLLGPLPGDALQLDQPIKVTGLVRSIRKQKNVAFARIGDGSTLANIQAVFPDPLLAKEFVIALLKGQEIL